MLRIPREMSWWAAICETFSIMKEVVIVGIGTHVIAAAVAISVGWGNPFANHVDPISLRGFAVSVVVSGSFIGTLIMCPLIPLLMQKISARTSDRLPKNPMKTIVNNGWIVMRQSLGTLAISPLVPGAATMLMLWGGVPLVKYNGHTLFMCIAVNLCSVTMAINYRRFCRLQASAHSAASRRQSSVQPEPGNIQPAEPRRRGRYSWKRSAYRALRVSTPSTVTAIIAIQYITISRRVPFDSANTFVIFAVASSLLKTLLPVAVKFYIARHSIRDPRNAFFMVSAPLFHIEIQLRMAMLRAQATTPLFITSGFVNVVELVARASAVAFDLALVRRAEKRLARKKAQLRVSERDGDRRAFQTQLRVLDETHKKWKGAHFRVCAAETIAGMAAEYCAIGLMTIFELILHGNASIALPRHGQASKVEHFRYGVQVWATQMGFEMVTDVIATTMEIRLGIPLLQVIKNDVDGFIRWAIAIITAQASGTCISSFIVNA